MPDFLKLPELDWTEAGAPVSRAFGDVYFSREDGLAETRAVFLQGCGLPEAWAGRRHFTVAELGFGTGLNILALLDLWSRHRPPGGRLHIHSVEAHPLWRDAAAAAHQAWPELAGYSKLLLERWPYLTPGLHRIDLPEFGAVLDLSFGDAVERLGVWAGKADAWFLDGFAPSANPAMWSDEVLRLVAEHSAPGARVATFTVAGQVRRGLAAQGFQVDKRPGHGRKRERLEAVYPGQAADPTPPGRVAVIGAGIAGATVSRAFQRLGHAVTVFDAEGAGAGASGAPAALVTPWVDAGMSPTAVLAAQAFQRAVRLYASETPQAVIDQGVVRAAKDAHDLDRLLRVAGQPIWPGIAMSELHPVDVAGLTLEADGPAGIWLFEAMVIEPLSVLSAWLEGVEVSRERVTAIEAGDAPLLRLEGGETETFDQVIIAAGWGSAALGAEGLCPVRGQLIWTDDVETGRAMIWGPGYAIPSRGGALIGATHDRGRSDAEPAEADTERLLQRLSVARPALAARIGSAAMSSRAAVRAVTPDHRPLCGQTAPGVWTLSGLGGRGFSWAPLLAEHLAAIITATPSPLSTDHHGLIDPVRAPVARPGRDRQTGQTISSAETGDLP